MTYYSPNLESVLFGVDRNLHNGYVNKYSQEDAEKRNPVIVFDNIREFIRGGKTFAERKIGKNVLMMDHGNEVVVRYHNTDIFAIHVSGSYMINAGGYYTSTTKSKINLCLQAVGSPWRVVQKNWEWYLLDGNRQPGFENPRGFRFGFFRLHDFGGHYAN